MNKPTMEELIEQSIVYMGSDWDDDPDPNDLDIITDDDHPYFGWKYIGAKPYVNCNDLFVWACADGEDITEEDLPEFYLAIEDCGGNIKTGSDLYCCRKRGMRPQGACYSYYDKKYWFLFNACGPERETGFGNPCTPGQYKINKTSKSIWTKIKEFFNI